MTTDSCFRSDFYLLTQAKAERQEKRAELSRLEALPLFVALLLKRVLFACRTLCQDE